MDAMEFVKNPYKGKKLKVRTPELDVTVAVTADRHTAHETTFIQSQDTQNRTRFNQATIKCLHKFFDWISRQFSRVPSGSACCVVTFFWMKCFNQEKEAEHNFGKSLNGEHLNTHRFSILLLTKLTG